jgi:hypothetical protein
VLRRRRAHRGVPASEEPADRPQGGQAAGLAVERRERTDRQRGERSATLRQHAALGGAAPVAERTRLPRARCHAVDDDLAHADPRGGQRRHAVARFSQRKRLREQHPAEPATFRRLQQARQLAPVGLELLDQPVGAVRAIAASEALGEEPMLGVHVVENGGDAAQRLGHGEKTQRVSGGRGIDHDRLVPSLSRHPRQLHQAHQLVHAREGQPQQPSEILVVQVGTALGACGAWTPPGEPPASARSASSSMALSEPPRGHASRARMALSEDVAQECAGSVETTGPGDRSRQHQRGRGRARGLAHPPLPAKWKAGAASPRPPGVRAAAAAHR